MKLPLERHTRKVLKDKEGNHIQFCMNYDVEELEKAYEEIKQKYDETLKKLEDKSLVSITWSVADFISRAVELEFDNELGSEDLDIITIEDARKHLRKYDPDKFEDTLYTMIRRHDAGIGITWDTVDCYLDEYCKKDK